MREAEFQWGCPQSPPHPVGSWIANHKLKGDKLIVNGEIRCSRTEKDGRTFYNSPED